MRLRKVSALQIIHSMLEQDPANKLLAIAEGTQTGILTREPHAWGLLDGTYAVDSLFPASDARVDKRMEWLQKGVKKIPLLDFLIEDVQGTLGQIAIRFCLAAKPVSSVFPNITSVARLEEFARASDIGEIPHEDMERISEVYENHFSPETQATPLATEE